MLLSILTLALVPLSTSIQSLANQHIGVRLEFRLAEPTPAEGLEETTIESTGEKLYLHKEAIITNKDVIEAWAVPSYAANRFDIAIDFSEEGAKRIAKASTENIGKRLAILVDGKVVYAPVLRTPISDKAIISGYMPSFTKEEAEQLARKIKPQ
jgi:preprotein translocase subunit SecD